MTTETTPLKCPIDEVILRRFTAPDRDTLKDLLLIYINRGDLTQTGEDRLRLAVGEERYAHIHWDTGACNGRVLILARRFKHPSAVESSSGYFPAEWFWCFDQIEVNEDVEAASAAMIARVPLDIREALKALPNLAWKKVRRINYTSYGRGKPKRKHKAAPEGLAFFTFDGGLGVSVMEEPCQR